jgi:hypothetical protein
MPKREACPRGGYTRKRSTLLSSSPTNASCSHPTTHDSGVRLLCLSPDSSSAPFSSSNFTTTCQPCAAAHNPLKPPTLSNFIRLGFNTASHPPMGRSFDRWQDLLRRNRDFHFTRFVPITLASARIRQFPQSSILNLRLPSN